MKIILLRHGETVWNKEGRLQGCQDIPLAPNGFQQIRHTGDHLATSDLNIDLIISSPLQRARNSAEIIAEAINYAPENIIASSFFIERGFGECEGFTYAEAMAKYPDGNYPGMETLEELYKRAENAIHYLEETYPDKTVLVASHGALIKSVLVVMTHGKIGYFDKDIWIDNGSYCILEKETDDWKILLHSRGDNFSPKYL